MDIRPRIVNGLGLCDEQCPQYGTEETDLDNTCGWPGVCDGVGEYADVCPVWATQLTAENAALRAAIKIYNGGLDPVATAKENAALREDKARLLELIDPLITFDFPEDIMEECDGEVRKHNEAVIKLRAAIDDAKEE